MRDKYIELIINFIKEKPGYEAALDDIKKEVLALGATEAEFDEAIKKITGSLSSTGTSTILQNQPAADFISANTIQPEFTTSKQSKIIKKIEMAFKAKSINSRKKYAVAIAFTLIFILLVSQVLTFNAKPKNTKITTDVNNKTTTKPEAKLIPIVYANSQSVDAEKIFSIKSNKIQLTVTGKPKKEVLGFFPYWMISKYDQIAMNTLTTISLFGLDADGKGNIIETGSDESSSGWAMWRDPNLDSLIAKARAYGLKITLTIKSFNNENIENLVNSDAAQKNLISKVSYLVDSKNLDGVNIDFEYIGSPDDKTRNGFTRLITNLNAELKRQKPKSILTVDTYLVSGSNPGLFDIPALALNSDALVIMGYDMHTPKGEAGPIAAMGGETNVVGYVQNYLEKIDPSKIILAVPYYGYDWPKNLALGEGRTLPYAEIAQSSKNAQLTWNEISQTPSFIYKDKDGTQRIVHFDNVRSLAIKYDFINKKNLRGVGIWALGYDGQNQDLEKLLIDKFINQ